MNSSELTSQIRRLGHCQHQPLKVVVEDDKENEDKEEDEF